MSLTKARAKSAQNAIITIFFTQGVIGITQIPRIPELIDQIGASFAIWGLITGLSGLGGLLGLLITAPLIARFGTKNVSIFGGIGQSLMVSALVFAHDPLTFLIFSGLGAVSGSTLNIALNSQSVALQKALNKVVIGKFHAAWSIGATVSAVISGFLATFMPLWLHLLLVPILGSLVLFVAGQGLLLSSEDGHGSANSTVKKVPFFKMPGQVVLLAAGMFTSVFGELMMMDWSAVYSQRVLNLDAGRGAIPYAIFSAAMIFGRLMIGRLTKKWHFSSLARISGMLAGASMLAGILLGSELEKVDQTLALITVSFCFALAGLGAAPMVPSFFSAAGYVKGLNTAQAMARMSFIASSVTMLAKFAMGGLAEGIGVTGAFMFPVATFFIAGLLSGVVAKRAKTSDVLNSAYPSTGAMVISDK